MVAEPAADRDARAPAWAFWTATVGGAGLVPRGPGTAGALVALPLAVALSRAGQVWLVAATAGLTLLGWLVAQRVYVASPEDDPQIVVIDELAGQLLTFIGIAMTPISVILGLALFRLFDIWKPFPIGWLDEHLRGGLGIMADDVAAGAIACVILHAVGVWW